MSNQSFAKLSRDERYEARKRARLGNDNSFEGNNDVSVLAPGKGEGNGSGNFEYLSVGNGPSGNFSMPMQNMPPPNMGSMQSIPSNPNLSSIPAAPSYQNLQPIPNIQNYNPASNISQNLSEIHSIEQRRLLQQQENPRGRTPPSNSFFLNPVSDAELKRNKMLEEYKSYALNDSGRKRDEVYREDPGNQKRNFADAHQIEEEKRRIYNIELKRQIEEKESNKRMNKMQEKVEEYFPFGKPGAGAPFRDPSGKIIAARPPRFNENDPNFNRIAQVRGAQDSYQQNPNYQGYQIPPSYPPQYPSNPVYAYQGNPANAYPSNPANAYPSNPANAYPSSYPSAVIHPNYQNIPPPQSYPQGQGPGPSSLNYQNNPNYSNNSNNIHPSNLNNPRGNPEPESFIQPLISNHYEEKSFDPRTEIEKIGEANKKTELQRALQEQIEEKRRQKEEEKRRKLLEERYEEERLARERQQMEEEFKREAEKKKKQIDDLNSFNSGNVGVVAQKKQRRPRTPIDLPPPEVVYNNPTLEDSKRRGQSAITRSQAPYNPSTSNPTQYQNVPSNDIPQEYISFLNSQLDRKLNEFKSEYKVQELRQQEEILRLRQREQVHSEQNTEAQREIERLKDELRRKQLEDDIRHRELTMALQARPNPIPVTKLPPYEPRPFKLPSGIEDASLSLDFAQKSLVGESKFIPLPNMTELFPTKPSSPREKKALGLDSIFPSLPDNSSNYDTFRSASSSLGVDHLLKKNEERLRALDKINPDTQDELNKLDEILFKFADVKEKNDAPVRAGSRGKNEVKKPDGGIGGMSGYDGDSGYGMNGYGRKVDTPLIYSKGEFLPSIKELDGEATYSLPEANKGLYSIY